MSTLLVPHTTNSAKYTEFGSNMTEPCLATMSATSTMPVQQPALAERTCPVYQKTCLGYAADGTANGPVRPWLIRCMTFSCHYSAV